MFVKIRKLTLIKYYFLSFKYFSRFTNCLSNVFIVEGSSSEQCCILLCVFILQSRRTFPLSFLEFNDLVALENVCADIL